MSVVNKYHKIQVVTIQPEERLASTSELNLAPNLVTGCDEARMLGYRAATHLKSGSMMIDLLASSRRRWL